MGSTTPKKSGTIDLPTVQPDGDGLASSTTPKLVARRFQTTTNTNIKHVYQISDGNEVDGIVHTVEAIAAFARDHEPGRYTVIERYPSGRPDSTAASRQWGEVTHHEGGKVAIRIAPTADPAPFGDHNRTGSSPLRRSAWYAD